VNFPIRLRFVHGTAASSAAIEFKAGLCLPIVPSHVECVRDDGKYVGAHEDGGVMARDPGYDGAKPEDEFFIDLYATFGQYRGFYDYIDKSLGQPYDWKAILGFALPPEAGEHQLDHMICSALIFLALRKGADWFPSHAPVAVPAHAIDPRDLLLMISSIVPLNFDRKAPTS
jgi:hypothetical protein